MAKTTWRGVTLDDRSAKMMEEVAQNTGKIYVHPTQGCYNAGGVAASAGTHDRGGAIDIAAANLAQSEREKIVLEMRRVGWAAWLRTPYQSDWPWHIHGIAVGCSDLSAGAAAQVRDYFNGRNGLASGAPDDGPRQFVGMTWERYKKLEEEMGLSDTDVEKIAAAVNRALGDWTADGAKRPGPPKDGDSDAKHERADQRIREIEKVVRRIEKKLNG